ncbi:hypothetical protein AMATHDRAFT_198817 [Amanita thiersii Skay4041]|uniref:Peptidase C14 caspase domain-containing protein n=1 Tax=Amanita thiersii Skay4041 TaxID=703135 RepID=A0A2A9N888_9AGAR|nr:hypothetical protein AMATHDRAFT_198817 [Amanita thiersii Skay4041]
MLGLPCPNSRFVRSRCTGRKRALCIGINYTGQRDELNGCINDAKTFRNFLIDRYGFRSSDVMLLTDDNRDPEYKPTRKNMIESMKWLIQGAQKDDSLVIHYSGHGGQKRDEGGHEADGMDEVIFPLDFKQSGDIVDDEMNKILVQPLPSGCRLTVRFTILCCHSGTVLDLPYLHSAHGRIKKTHISMRARIREAPVADVISFSACKDDETSADTFEGGMYVGAMSYVSGSHIFSLFFSNQNQTYDSLLNSVRRILQPKYKQKAQLGASNPVNLDLPFIL